MVRTTITSLQPEEEEEEEEKKKLYIIDITGGSLGEFPKTRAHTRSQPVLIRYLDHLLFRNVQDVPRPCVRETIGWIVKEDHDHIGVLWDKSVEELPNEMTQGRISGITVLKPAIVEIERLCPLETPVPETQRGQGRKHG